VEFTLNKISPSPEEPLCDESLIYFCPRRNGDPQLHWQEVADFKNSFCRLALLELKEKAAMELVYTVS
jgi:hypothetical protein